MNFADNLKHLRESKQLTQEQLADHLKVSRSTIAGYESEHHHPDFENLEKISTFFHVSIDFLLTDSEDFSNCEIWESYTKLSPESKQKVLKYIKLLQGIDKNAQK